MSTTAEQPRAPAPPPPPPPPLIPSLSDDVALNILARIPRCHHPTLSLVSKRMRSLVSSPLLYTARSLLHCTEHFLYLSIRLRGSPSLHFYTLYQSPTENPKNTLIPLPPIPSPSLVGSAVATVDHTIYVIGGSINDVSSSRVWSLDCRTHTWESAPSMRVSREFAATGVLDDKVYVIGGCVVDSWARSKNWAEVFDPTVGEWNSVPSPIETRDKWMHASAVIDGKIYAMADRNGVFYEASSGCWGVAECELDLGWRGRACVVDGVLYCYDYLGKIRGYDAKEGAWRELRGVEKGLPRFLCGATMANFGGKLVVVWEDVERRGSGSEKETDVWCAEIEVEKGEAGELRGNIKWCDVVLTVPCGSSIVHCLAVTL
ncbi:hypothetical protein SLA2020_410910 [Shorea laevis]